MNSRSPICLQQDQLKTLAEISQRRLLVRPKLFTCLLQRPGRRARRFRRRSFEFRSGCGVVEAQVLEINLGFHYSDVSALHGEQRPNSTNWLNSKFQVLCQLQKGSTSQELVPIISGDCSSPCAQHCFQYFSIFTERSHTFAT